MYTEKNTNSNESKSNRKFLNKFKLKVNENIDDFEYLAITGNVKDLGNWRPEKAIIMKQISNNRHEWEIDVEFDEMDESINIEYRYFICALSSDQVIIRKWESDIYPRRLQSSSGNIVSDTFGKDQKVTKGWLNIETILQLKLHRNPFQFYESGKYEDLRIKVDGKQFKFDANGNIEFKELPYKSSGVIVEVAKIKENESDLIVQNRNGLIYQRDDIIVYHITVANMKKIAYFIYLIDGKSEKVIGQQYILPTEIKDTDGDIIAPIISQTTLNLIGTMNISYVLIRPYRNIKLDFQTSFSSYWKNSWTALDIGHRGLGASLKYLPNHGPPVVENTLISLLKTSYLGADLVECDVHLTKDLIPIIFHDFYLTVALDNSKTPESDADLIDIFIKDFTYEQLKTFKTFKYVNNQVIEYPSYNNENRSEYRLLPTLEELFENVSKFTGFDIEVKWPNRYLDERPEQRLDKNIFIDRILSTVIEKGCGRPIVFSSFDADICTMLRFKQNMFPVLSLIRRKATLTKPHWDSRCDNLKCGILNAHAMQLFGTVSYTENFSNDNDYVRLAKDLKQKIFTWGGEDIDSKEAVQRLKDQGLTGVIFDRLDLYKPDMKNYSVFKENDEWKVFEMQCSNKLQTDEICED